MADKTQAKADSGSMADEYVRGATIDDLADKFGLTPHEVEKQVVTPAGVRDENLVTQAEIDAQEAKKGK